MQFVYEMTYDADPHTVWTMSVDEKFIAGRCAAAGAEHCEISVQHRADGGVAVRVRRRLPTSLPPIASAIIGDHVTVADTHTWRAPDAAGNRTGTFHGHVVGVPVHMAGTLRLVGEAGVVGRSGGPDTDTDAPAVTGAGTGAGSNRTKLTISGEIGVHLPVVGDRIAPHVAQLLRRNFDLEQEFARLWLSERA